MLVLPQPPQPLQPSQLVSRWEWVRGVVKGEGVERGNRWEKARRERRGEERGEREGSGRRGERVKRGSLKGRADTLRNLNPRHLRPPQVAESRQREIPETSHIGITGQ